MHENAASPDVHIYVHCENILLCLVLRVYAAFYVPSQIDAVTL